MSKSRLEWKVGLFVFIGLVLLAGLLVEFSKGLTFFKSTYIILLRAENAGSLKARAQVLMSGVPVGSVADIRLAPSGKYVTIDLRIFSKYLIHKDARFVIEQSGFLGDQYVGIIPTENADGVYHDQEIAHTEPPFNLQETARSATGFIERINQTAQRLDETLVDVRRYLLNQETLTNLSLTAANLRAASERAVNTMDGFNAVLATNAPALSRAGTNLVVVSEELNHFATNLNGLLAANRPAIDHAVKNVEDSTTLLKQAMEDVQAGKGLAGGLLHNDQMANDLAQIARNLSITSSNLNQRGLWGILWRQKTPKTPPPAESAPTPLTTPKNPFK